MTIQNRKPKCVICGTRPVKVGGRCGICSDKIKATERSQKSVQPVKFLLYRGAVVGLFKTKAGTYKGTLLQRSEKHLPKCRTINLDTYCPGYDRQQIKKFKRCVQSLVHA